MVNKFVVALAGAVAVMALLVAVPRVYNPAGQTATNTQFNIEYDRQVNATQQAGGDSRLQVLTISSDGFASLSRGASLTSFQLTSDELSEVNSLIFDTGFMNIHTSASWQSQSGSVPKDTIKVQSGATSQDVTWSEGGASASTIPPLISRVQGSLDAIIAAHAETP